MIKIIDISFQVGMQKILHPMSFEVEAGEITILLGANGAGKSTLMKILAGEQAPHSGQIFLDNQLLSKYTAQKLAQKRAVLTQHYSVPLPFCCEEIVMMGRYPYEGKTTHKENKQIVEDCMKEMAIDHFSKRMFSSLSGGEQQRVQMARVLAQLAANDNQQNKILMLDEPTSSLDYLQQQLLLSKVKKLAKRGYAVIVVLHDLNLAAQYGDKILLLKKGHLLADGSSGEVLKAPMISMAYGLTVDIIQHDDYPFPIIMPSSHQQKNIHQTNKLNKNGIYSKQTVIE